MTLAMSIIHIVICVLLILIVLLQTSKGADIGAAFGGGSSQTLFGSAGPGGFLTKITTGVAIIFMVTSIGLAYFSSHKTGASIMKESQPQKTVRSFLESQKIPYFDFLDILSQFPVGALNFKRDGHLNKEGHRQIAKAILIYFVQNYPIFKFLPNKEVIEKL